VRFSGPRVTALGATSAMSDFCSLCHAVEDTPYCAQHGVVHRAFVIGGHYEVAQLIALGSSSFVFGAKDLRHGTPVAVKVPRMRLSIGREAQRRQVDELALRAYDRLTGIVDLGWDDPLGVSFLVVAQAPDQAADTLVQRLLSLDPLISSADSFSGTEATETFEVPPTIGSYRVVEPLGTGGHGRVYLGEHPLIGSKVAIKLLRQDYARSSETVERFIQEARASSQIGSPHIPRYFDFGTTPAGVPYAIMEYFEGETLGQRLLRGTMSVGETAQVVEQVASALAMAHDAGLIHRDLKPDNLFLVKADARRSAPTSANYSASVARPGEAAIDVKVLDFGIAKMVGTLSATRTESGSFLGTPYYCAPEQVFGRPVDARTDVYCLGATAYEMLTGTPPFVGEVHEILSAKATQEAPALQISGLPPLVADTIRRMLARDPEDRAPSMTWVLAQVERWLSSDAAGRADTATTWNETDRTLSHDIPELDELDLAPAGARRGTRRRIALVALAVTTAVAIGLTWRSRAPQPPPAAARTIEPGATPVATTPPVAPPPVAPPAVAPPTATGSAAAKGSAAAIVDRAVSAPASAVPARSPGEGRTTSGEGPRTPIRHPRPPSERKPGLKPARPPADAKDVLIVDPFVPAP
jgi:eukaryotic-like serine/threonine-protein kinase